MENNSFDLTLLGVTEEQQTSVETLFRDRGWFLNTRRSEVSVSSGDNIASISVERDSDSPALCSVSGRGVCPGLSVGSEGGESRGIGGAQVSVPVPAEGECLFCFCLPCVATCKQKWLGSGQPANIRNSAIRKRLYKKYWTMMSTRNAWRHPLYIQKKTRTLSIDNPCTVNIQREIMPECILDLVRGLYPNPNGIPYQGHHWW